MSRFWMYGRRWESLERCMEGPFHPSSSADCEARVLQRLVRFKTEKRFSAGDGLLVLKAHELVIRRG